MVDGPKIEDVQNVTGIFLELATILEKAGMSSAAAGALMERLEKSLHLLGGAGKEAATSLSMYSDKAKLTTAANQVLGQSADASISVFDRLKTMTTQQANTFNMLGAAALGASSLLKNITKDATMASFSDQIKAVIGDATELTAPIAAFAKSLGILPDSFGTFAELKAKIVGLGEAMEQHMTMQRAVFNMSAQTGQLNTLFQQTGVGLANLGNVAKDYENDLNAVSKATHTNMEDAGKFFNALSSLPPAFDASKEGAQRVSDQMKQMQTNLTLAAGSGQTYEQVIGQSQSVLENFKVSQQNVNEVTLRGAELTKNYGINIGDTTGFLTSMISPFEMLGDQTESMTGVFNEFFQGLRDGGLGIKPAIDTIADMGKSLAGLSVAQRGFISAQSGGPGGLLGGLLMQKDIMAGGDKAKGAMDKMINVFKQKGGTGGQLTTLDQVNANDPASAVRYQKEVSMLMSGTTGLKAKDEGQAAAMIKAMNAGGGKANMASAALLLEVNKQGVDYQKLSATRMDDIAKSVDAIKMQGGAAAADLAQDAFTDRGATEGEKKYLTDATDYAKSILNQKGGGGQDQSGKYSNQNMTALGDSFHFDQMGVGLMNSINKNFGIGQTAEKEDTTAKGTYSKLEKERAQLQAQMKSGTGNLEHDEITKRMSYINAVEKKYNLGPRHQEPTAQKTGRATSRTGAIGQTASSDPGNLSATINVYIDGKKVQQNNQSAALLNHPVSR